MLFLLIFELHQYYTLHQWIDCRYLRNRFRNNGRKQRQSDKDRSYMSVTIKKIANDLNLAVSTVSKALRDSHEISPETKKKVFEYAEKLNYLPNPYASSLKRRRTGNIAVVLPEVADSFFYTAINGIESIAREKGYHVLVYLTHDDLKREESIIREFRSGRVD